MTKILLIALSLTLLAGCSQEATEKRAREAAEKIKESIPDVEAKALAQKTTPDEVQRAQQALTAVNEYQGEPDGKLDSVTVNAIEAFQRAHGLRADGMLNEKTERLLQDAVTKR
jgi:peptidoglycan hydrolase-like protein with peptidoglycan-binding domain